jgi:hypothetical protein
MDKEEARFILRCFRPDGADAENPEFSAALTLAAKDRELSEWLVTERAQDAAFAQALARVEIPDGLRHEILSSLALERGDLLLGPDDGLDQNFMQYLSEVSPPVNLRADILAAMNLTASGAAGKAMPRKNWRWWIPIAAAAGIAAAISLQPSDRAGVVTNGQASNIPSANIVQASHVTMDDAENAFIKTFESPDFTLTMENPDHQAIFNHLHDLKLPCAEGALPKGLQNVPGLGCRELVIDGKRGTLVCFKEDGGLVHLVIFKRDDICGPCPCNGKPQIGRSGQWAHARWEERGKVFILMSQGAGADQRLASLF